jgi:hypothetical protein
MYWETLRELASSHRQVKAGELTAFEARVKRFAA